MNNQRKIYKSCFLAFILFQLIFSSRIEAKENEINYQEVIDNSVQDDSIFNSDKGKEFPYVPPATAAQNTARKNLITIILIAGGAITLIGGSALGYSLITKNKRKESLLNDQIRKYDLERICYALSAYYKSYGFFPNAKQGAFLEVTKNMDPIPRDPLSGKVNSQGKKYNYYYDNQSLNANERGRENIKYYRAWCYLENSNDPDINEVYGKTYKNIYLKTSNDPLNPVLLEDPRFKKISEVKVAGVKNIGLQTISPEDIENQRKESLLKFLVILIGIILGVSAIVNGVLYYLVSQK